MNKNKNKTQVKGHHLDPQVKQSLIELINETPLRRDRLIEYLHKIQDTQGYLGSKQLVALADLLKISPSQVYEVASFYHHFDLVKEGEQTPPELTIRVCNSLSCELAGSEALLSQLQAGLGDKVRVTQVPCVGRCDSAPVAVVGQNPIGFGALEQIEVAVKTHDIHETEITGHQSYAQYAQAGGYQLYRDCLAGNVIADDVIAQLQGAGLRGLGGAGFPAGKKWEIVKSYAGPRYLAVNLDEGEPGTFKDRHYLEQDPHRFIEGMLIACWAVEIEKAYIYVRDEYPACRVLLEDELAHAIKNLEATGITLPEIELRRGAGAYICGEESAMVESIEGKRGTPRQRPPFLAEVGLFGQPTLEHNFETLFWVREILEKGSDWFTAFGRNGRKGLRSFSVSGRVKKPGVYLVPAGISVNELIEEYCGGMLEGHTLYGYFPGGASGGILPADKANIPLDFDTLQEFGCFIGSAAVVVFSDQDSARKLALNAMNFFAHESCGQCTPCRVGTQKACQLMRESSWDVPLMADLTQVMQTASICGLGQAAPNPMKSVIQYFPSEVL